MTQSVNHGLSESLFSAAVSGVGSVAVAADRCRTEVAGGHKTVVSFIDNADFAIPQRQLEKCDDPVRQKLRRHGPAAHPRKPVFDETDVLRGLDDADLILSALGLHRDHEMAAEPVEPDVEFVNLDLADVSDSCAKMVLQAVGRETKEGVDQPVVADDGQKRLFIVQCIGADDLWRGVGDIDGDHVGTRQDAVRLDQAEPVACTSGPFDDPLEAIWLCGEDFGGKRRAVSERVWDITDVLRQLYGEECRLAFDL